MLKWFLVGAWAAFLVALILVLGLSVAKKYETPKDAPVARLCTTEKINPWHFDEPLWEYCDHVPMKSNI